MPGSVSAWGRASLCSLPPITARSASGRPGQGARSARGAAPQASWTRPSGSGADLSKVRATEGVFGDAEDLDRLQLGRSELAAAVTEAHRAGRLVAAHAYSAQGIGNAIDAGADTLEHASFLDERTARSAAAGAWTTRRHHRGGRRPHH
jgi:Amidohydrolase family